METFSCFPLLPIEIQLEIWEAACRVERVLPLLPGQGHLGPVTHSALAVPPILHVCSNSRKVGLRFYNLAFHPRVYTNRDHDLIMVHIHFPFQRIDPVVYAGAGFNWSVPPRRLAVFLDDIGVEDTESIPISRLREGNRFSETPHGATSWNRYLLFSTEFIESTVVTSARWSRFDEVVLLILPPLTGRPNPVTHQIELVDVPPPGGMSQFLQEEAHRRCTETWQTNRNIIPQHPVAISVRFATCKAWDPLPSIAVPPPMSIEISEKARLQVQGDVEALRSLFSRDQGLGQMDIWERMLSVPLRYLIQLPTRRHISVNREVYSRRLQHCGLHIRRETKTDLAL